MTNDSILEAVHCWAKESQLNYDAVILREPPAFLDLRRTIKPEELPEDQSGVCLTVREPDVVEEAPASLACWIPSSGQAGSYLMFREGDSEIDIKEKRWFFYRGFKLRSDEEVIKEGIPALLGNLGFAKVKFYLEYVMFPTLCAWLDSKGLIHNAENDLENIDKLSFESACSGEACFVGRDGAWKIIQFREPWNDYPYPTTIGVSGRGEVGTFCADEDGFTCFFEQADGLKTSSELKAWLYENIQLSQL